MDKTGLLEFTLSNKQMEINRNSMARMERGRAKEIETHRQRDRERKEK